MSFWASVLGEASRSRVRWFQRRTLPISAILLLFVLWQLDVNSVAAWSTVSQIGGGSVNGAVGSAERQLQPAHPSLWPVTTEAGYRRFGSTAGVTIRVKPMAVVPGGPLRYRIENRGNSGIAYGLKFVIQQEVAVDAWEPAPFTPKGPWPQVLAHLAAGQVGRWQAVQVPSDAESGHYRIKKEVRLDSGRRFLLGSFGVREP